MMDKTLIETVFKLIVVGWIVWVSSTLVQLKVETAQLHLKVFDVVAKVKSIPRTELAAPLPFGPKLPTKGTP